MDKSEGIGDGLHQVETKATEKDFHLAGTKVAGRELSGS